MRRDEQFGAGDRLRPRRHLHRGGRGRGVRPGAARRGRLPRPRRPGCARSACSARARAAPSRHGSAPARSSGRSRRWPRINPEIAEIDVNPLLVVGHRPGGRRRAGDPRRAPATMRAAAGRRQRRRARRQPHLDAVFAPRSVAVVGASEDADQVGRLGDAQPARRRLRRRALPHQPARRHDPRAAGLCRRSPTCRRRPTSSSSRSAARRRPPSSRSAAATGCPRPIVIAAGFGEAGEEGAALQLELARAADDGGVTLVGPNCMGVLCTSSRLSAVGFVTLRPEPGPLSVISQSGNIGTQLLMTRGAARHRRGEVREQRQSGDDRRQRPARVPGGRPADRRRRDVPRGHGGRATLLRPGARDDAAQAGHRDARRHERRWAAARPARTPAPSRARPRCSGRPPGRPA